MSPIKLLIALFGLLVWANPAFADGVLAPAANESSLTVTEVDGSPAVTVNRLKVTNGTLTDNGDGTATVTVGGGLGDVVGPASSTDNALVRFDLTTGKLVQSSGVLLSDTNDMSGAASYAAGTTPATAGLFRAPNNTNGPCWRNAANSANFCVKLNASNEYEFDAPINITGTAGPSTITEIAAPGAPSTAGKNNVYVDSTTHRWASHTNGGAVKDYLTTDDTQTVTGKSIDCGGTGNTCTIKQERYQEVAGCNNATAGPVYNLPTSNAAVPACDTGTNQFSAYLGFNDTTDQSTHGSFRLPTGYSGGIDWMFRYKMASATTGAVGWCVQLVRLATGAAGDPAFPAQAAGNCVSQTVPGTAGYESEATITNVTCTSCAAGDRVFWRVARDADGGAVTDSATGDARLIFSGPAYAVGY